MKNLSLIKDFLHFFSPYRISINKRLWIGDSCVTDVELGGDWLPWLVDKELSKELCEALELNPKEKEKKIDELLAEYNLQLDVSSEIVDCNVLELIDEKMDESDYGPDEIDPQWVKDLPDGKYEVNFYFLDEDDYHIADFNILVPMTGKQMLQLIADHYCFSEADCKDVGIEYDCFYKVAVDHLLIYGYDYVYRNLEFIDNAHMEEDCACVIRMIENGTITKENLNLCREYFEDSIFEEESFEDWWRNSSAS